MVLIQSNTDLVLPYRELPSWYLGTFSPFVQYPDIFSFLV